MHADDFRTDKHGVVSQLSDGGYSDDMTLAAIASNTFSNFPIFLLFVYSIINYLSIYFNRCS